MARRFDLRRGLRTPPLIRTPGELVDFLATAAGQVLGVDAPSLKQRAFYRVRRYLSHRTGVPPERIRPRTTLVELLPEPARRPAEWARLRNALGMPEAPHLRRSPRTRRLLATAAGSGWIAGAAVAFAVGSARLAPAMLLTSTATVAFGIASLWLTRASCVHIVPPALSVGDLAAYCTAYGSPLLGSGSGRLSRSQIREVVRDLMRLELGVSAVRWDAPWDELVRSVGGAHES